MPRTENIINRLRFRHLLFLVANAHACVYININAHIYIYVCTYVCMHACMYVYIYMCVYIYVCLCYTQAIDTHHVYIYTNISLSLCLSLCAVGARFWLRENLM